LVLAIAQEASRDDTKPKVVNAVTLEVTPQQAERLDLARSVGTLSLVLRNQVDAQAATTDGARPGELLGTSFKGGQEHVAKNEDRTVERTRQPRPRSQKKDGRTQKAADVELLKGVERSAVQF
jgi:pilus assembly protein CpaB